MGRGCGEVGAPGACRSNKESRASKASAEGIAIDRASDGGSEAMVRIGSKVEAASRRVVCEVVWPVKGKFAGGKVEI